MVIEPTPNACPVAHQPPYIVERIAAFVPYTEEICGPLNLQRIVGRVHAHLPGADVEGYILSLKELLARGGVDADVAGAGISKMDIINGNESGSKGNGDSLLG